MTDRLRFTVPLAMVPADHLVPLARKADERGYDSVTVPDSVFYPEHVEAKYPYSPDGSRFWAPDTPFVDPVVALAAIAATTTRIRLTTNVVKLPLREPLLFSKQLASIGALADGRLALGIGLSWIPQEFEWTGTDMRTRGARADEMIEIIRLVCGGGGPRFVEYHGRHYDFGSLMISPAPQQPVPIIVGGHTDPALRRAARNDGWISVHTSSEEIARVIEVLHRERAALGRLDTPFEVNVLPLDVWDLDGYRRLADLGVTEFQTVPWYRYGGDPDDLQVRLDALDRFADEFGVGA